MDARATSFAFIIGFACGASVWLISAFFAGCSGPVAKNIPEKERAVISINLQIDRLSAQKAALLKAIEEEKKAAQNR